MDDEPDISDVSQISFLGSFDDQVLEILNRVRLSRDEVINLQQLINDLEYGLRRLWPDCKAYLFGSIVTGLGIRTSDVDCYVKLPEKFVPYKSPVILARNQLRMYPSQFSELFSIPAASVPILKFFHIPTGRHCDVNFKSPSGVRNSQLISYFMNVDERVLKLTILVKYWSKVYKFTGTNLLANYALTMMTIFYFQYKGILPSVVKLQMNTQMYVVDFWNTAFDVNLSYSVKNNESLYDLLGGFFKFYSSFDFNQFIISPYVGYAIHKKVFNDLNTVPPEYDLYKFNIINDYCKTIRLNSILCVQDPFDHSRNCTLGVFPKLADKILGLFKYAAKMYEEKDPRDFLRAVFNMEQVTVAIPAHHLANRNRNKIDKNKRNQSNKKRKQNCKTWMAENKIIRR